MNLDEYAAAMASLAVRWHRLLAHDPDAAERLLVGVLESGPDVLEEAEPELTLPSSEESIAWEQALIAASEAFDRQGYVAANSHIHRLRSGEVDPIDHFVRSGWTWLLSPRADFDVWWYWAEYLDAARSDINPFVHYLVLGRRSGLSMQPVGSSQQRVSSGPYPKGIRRICLFAAYDPEGIVDDYVVAYLAELSRYADVYYLADGPMDDGELAKLDSITKGAWAVRHGRYDFGSYSMLAGEFVGWETIDEYDELLFANDSCFLLSSLEPIFDRMNRSHADWWGLHATKRDFERPAGNMRPIPIEDAKSLHTVAEDWNPYYRLHLSSYFLAFRRGVFSDPGFRRRLARVTAQPHKALVIQKYEIGLSDYLIKSGYDFDTYLADLYPYLPVYTADFFTIVGLGFPVMKRNFITENPRREAGLDRWRERLEEVCPGAPFDLIARNIDRVAASDRLASSFAVQQNDDGEIVDPYAGLSPRQFRALDKAAPKHDHWWAFPVCAYDHTFAGNERAVFEEVRHDPSIKKIILTRSRTIEITGENVVTVPLESPEGQHYLARARQIFVKHGPEINVPWPVDALTHNFINLWHGIPLKRFGTATLRVGDAFHPGVLRSHGKSRAVVASSTMDALAMTSAFFPASYPDVWPTGLPRNDFILRPDDQLPEDLLESVERLRKEVGGRRLVLFLPTFKDAQADAYYAFDEAEVGRLKAWAQRHNAVIGVREHMADKANMYGDALAGVGTIDLSARRYPDLEVLYRVADALVSDYSSCLVDFLMTGKPVISFAYDYERYAGAERGLFYDLSRVLPGPVCRTFDELADALGTVFQPRSPEDIADYEWKRRIFFAHIDDQASWRVSQRVKGLYRTS